MPKTKRKTRKRAAAKPKVSPKPKIGRPLIFSENTAMEICALIAQGWPLTRICRRDDMPCLQTVYTWFQKEEHAPFLEAYRRAREDQADTLADEIIEIADDGSQDTVTRHRSDGSEYDAENTEWTNRSKLRVAARQWVAAKMKPKKYGERITQEISGEMSLRQLIEITQVPPKPTIEARADPVEYNPQTAARIDESSANGD